MLDDGTVGGNVRQDVLMRLKRIEGQVHGLQSMIESERSCEDVVMQLAAVKAAVVNVAMTVLASEMTQCLGIEAASSADIDRALERFMKVFRKFS